MTFEMVLALCITVIVLAVIFLIGCVLYWKTDRCRDCCAPGAEWHNEAKRLQEQANNMYSEIQELKKKL